jgi:hypothetical protein
MKILPIPATLSIALMLAVSPAITKAFSPPPVMNPPPSAKFSDFTKFEVTNIVMTAPFAGKGPNEQALGIIQREFTASTSSIIMIWNTAGAKAEKVRTLLIEPKVEGMKFVPKAARIWVGAMAGGSYVLISMKVTDKESGQVIATPMFYAHASAWSGAWGTGDDSMLTRIAQNMSNYVSGNYATAVGGISGSDAARK